MQASFTMGKRSIFETDFFTLYWIECPNKDLSMDFYRVKGLSFHGKVFETAIKQIELESFDSDHLV